MGKRKITPTYIFFYILFLPDTWRLVIGICISIFLSPLVFETRPLDDTEKVMIYLMLATIGYVVAAKPARMIADFFKRSVLKDKRP